MAAYSPVQIEDTLGLETAFVLVIVDLLKDVLKTPIIFLEDSVLDSYRQRKGGTALYLLAKKSSVASLYIYM